ncbi:PIR protein [Plasmodium vivax]|uniref:VIR protein n=1 Tax=Plasmodium vivax TaxID=5855 RepID=A0A564ZP21_PLAVI|nr:PIR protein [Plasmodium vivax]
MVEDKKIYNLNNFLEGNDKLILSYLNTFYQSYFNISCEDRTYSNYYCSPDTNFETLPSYLWELYRKFERNLKLIWEDGVTVYDRWETDKKILCSYLKYWIYDQLIIEKVTDNDFSIFFNLWNARKNEKCSKCKCEFNIKSFYYVKQLKKTYDYSLFLKAYKKTAKINKKIHNMNYCKYIENAKAIYSLLGETCLTNSADYCKEFKEYVLPYIDYEESKTYEDVEKDEFTEEDEDTKEGEDLLAISCKEDLTYIPNQEELQEAEELLKKSESYKEKGQVAEADESEAQDHSFQETKERIGDHAPFLPLQKEVHAPREVSLNGLPIGEDGMINPILDYNSPDNGSPTKTIASASLVGVPSIIFLLYKFSPVRTWLDPRIRKTKSDLRNSIQGSNELQSHDYNFDTTNMDFNRFNVGYQSR